MSKPLPFAIAILATWGLIACGHASQNGAEVGTDEGMRAPEIEATTVEGHQFKLSELQGNFVLIDFWASWCGPCLREAPALVALHQEFAPKGLQIVSIAIEKNDKNWKKATEAMGYSWPHQIVEVNRFVRFNPIASDYNVTEIPAFFLLDTEGNVMTSSTQIEPIRQKLLENQLSER